MFLLVLEVQLIVSLCYCNVSTAICAVSSGRRPPRLLSRQQLGTGLRALAVQSRVMRWTPIGSVGLCEMAATTHTVHGERSAPDAAGGLSFQQQLSFLQAELNELKCKVADDALARDIQRIDKIVKEAGIASAKRLASAEVRIAEHVASFAMMKKQAKAAKTDQKLDQVSGQLATLSDRVETQKASNAVLAEEQLRLQMAAQEYENRMLKMQADLSVNSSQARTDADDIDGLRVEISSINTLLLMTMKDVACKEHDNPEWCDKVPNLQSVDDALQNDLGYLKVSVNIDSDRLDVVEARLKRSPF